VPDAARDWWRYRFVGHSPTYETHMPKPAPMTAEEWDASRAPRKMFTHIRENTNPRKLRLFTCACCRAVWDRLKNKECRRGVEVAERFADGEVSDRTRRDAQRRVSAVLDVRGKRDLLRLCASWALTKKDGWYAHFAAEVASHNTLCVVKGPRIQRTQADLLRCIFGNPLRDEVKFDKQWRTDTVVSLAKTMYDSRDFGAMPILADALQDAGCTDDRVLNHCRAPGATHARGCWVVDAVLGKG
jgi:hypothetical protein